MCEGVFPADDVALRPPGAHVGVLRFVDEDPTETLFADGNRGVQEVEFVEVLQVEQQRTHVAVNLEFERVLLTHGDPGDFNRSDGPGRKRERGPGGVVDRHFLQPGRAGAMRGEGVQPARDLGDLVREQEQHLVDRVAGDVPEGPGPGGVLVQPPGHRGCFVSEPVLQVGRPDVPDGSQPAFGDQLLCQGQGRDPPVVEADHGLHALRPGSPGGESHGLGLGQGVGQRLLQEHVLARLKGRDGDLGVQKARGADVHDLDVVAGKDRAPVRGCLRPAVPGRGTGHARRVTAHQDLLLKRRDIEKARDVPPGVRVGFAHKSVADHGHAERAHTVRGFLGMHGSGPREWRPWGPSPQGGPQTVGRSFRLRRSSRTPSTR